MRKIKPTIFDSNIYDKFKEYGIYDKLIEYYQNNTITEMTFFEKYILFNKHKKGISLKTEFSVDNIVYQFKKIDKILKTIYLILITGGITFSFVYSITFISFTNSLLFFIPIVILHIMMYFKAVHEWYDEIQKIEQKQN